MRGFAILGTILATLFAGLVWAADAKSEALPSNRTEQGMVA